MSRNRVEGREASSPEANVAFTERAASLADYSLPGEAWLTRADLSQDGFDLLLTLDGDTHRVADYFSFDVRFPFFEV